VVVHNPISNMRLGSGVLPLQYLLASGVPVAIGTDGAASNDTQDICEALKSASMLNTLYGGFRTWAQPEDVWRACLLGGAQAVGARIGRIEVGAAADVVLVRADRHVLAPRGHLVASLVNGGIKGSIDTVVVAGRLVVEDGTPVFPGARDLEARSRRCDGGRDDRAPRPQRSVPVAGAPSTCNMSRWVSRDPVSFDRRNRGMRGVGREGFFRP
jgi:cytosine/adenosine deaminase-related metal-dependent hydrolase